MRKVLLGLALLLSPVGYVHAAECKPTHVWADVQAKMAAQGFVAYQLRPGEHATFIVNYNADEPVSEWAPDAIWLLSHERSQIVYFALTEKGCVIAGERIDPVNLARLLTPTPKTLL